MRLNTPSRVEQPSRHRITSARTIAVSGVFSLDGGYVYVNADAWTTSNAVHQIEVATGKRRFVIDGSVLALIRTGRYRGYLLVQRHMYYGPPNHGSYNPVYVIRPDAKEVFPVPGSDNDHGAKSVARTSASLQEKELRSSLQRVFNVRLRPCSSGT